MYPDSRESNTHTQTHTLESVHDRRVRVENLSWQGQTEKSLSAAPQIVPDWVTFKDKKKKSSAYEYEILSVNFFPGQDSDSFLSICGNKNVTISNQRMHQLLPKTLTVTTAGNWTRHQLWRTTTPATAVVIFSCWVKLIGLWNCL